MSGELRRGQLERIARQDGIDPDEHDDLRDALDINECRWCGDEYVHGWSDKFCTDMCEVHYIKEYHR